MAYTVTYQRKTKSGKKVTVRRRVAGNKPGPGGPKKPTAKKATAKKAPSRSVAAKRRSTKRYTAPKKAPARKAPARKPARKAPARKSTARKTSPRKSTARKAAARKAPARKAPAKKAPARKANRVISLEEQWVTPAERARANSKRAFSKPSILMRLELETRRQMAITIGDKEIALRAALTARGKRFSNIEEMKNIWSVLRSRDPSSPDLDTVMIRRSAAKLRSKK